MALLGEIQIILGALWTIFLPLQVHSPSIFPHRSSSFLRGIAVNLIAIRQMGFGALSGDSSTYLAGSSAAPLPSNPIRFGTQTIQTFLHEPRVCNSPRHCLIGIEFIYLELSVVKIIMLCPM